MTIATETAAIKIEYDKISIEGVKIFYREAGNLDKPNLILFHGFPSASHMFRNLIPMLENDFHIVAMDYPAFGQSDMPSREKFKSAFASDTIIGQYTFGTPENSVSPDGYSLDIFYEKTKFCGYSLYQPQPPRNAKLASKRFLYGAEGLFQEHTAEEKRRLMQEYCAKISTEKVVAYCHYCVRGLKLGGKQGLHLASLLFESEKII